MFWSGNYIAVRELNSLLKEENVTLSQVLEADDILQECKADNKALIQFLTKPEILADLITLITEEPPKNVELATQYRYANIACEVLTSHLSMLSDRLSLDAAQMNRLCDFLNKDPPLNPLLASYFSKTVEMLLEKSPKQDWCLHHIVCLRVLDFFKSRRDFLPNLLRHMSTSAIADIFKYLMRIDDLIKTVMEWLEEHQFLECLIQIICGTYVPEVFSSAAPAPVEPRHEAVEKAERETSEKPDTNHTDDKGSGESNIDGEKESEPCSETEEQSRVAGGEAGGQAGACSAEVAAQRIASAASANAAALLCDLIVNGCRPRTGWVMIVSRLQSVRSVMSALQSERGVHSLLQGMFTSPPHARKDALVNGTQVLLALLHHDLPQRLEKCTTEEEAGRTYAEWSERGSVELAVAPHLPLLHHALLHDAAAAAGRVGLARVQLAALLAHLALSEVEEVASTMLTLGTPGVLVDMFFKYPNNNFLHAQVYTLVKHALSNRVYRTQYARHLLIECDLLTRLMDVFEENKNNKSASNPRAAYMGHVVLCLTEAARALAPPDLLAHALPLPASLTERCGEFLQEQLRPLLQQHDTPLGGYHPSENFYEVEIMPDTLTANYDFNDMAATAAIDDLTDDINADDINEMCGAVGSAADSPDFIADGLGIDDSDNLTNAKSNFLELASQRFDADMWEDSGDTDANDLDAPEDVVRDVLEQHSPWECAENSSSCSAEGGAGGGGGGGGGWAQFGAAAALRPHDPFAPAEHAAAHDADTPPADQHFADFFWGYDARTDANSESTTDLESNLHALRLENDSTDKRMDEASSVELANNLLTAMSAMSADAIANIVNANLPASPAPPAIAEPGAGPAAPSTGPAAPAAGPAAAPQGPAGAEHR